MRICKGCGVKLQYTDRTLPGYTPKEDSEYCQRCFRLIHYDDPVFSMREGIDPDEVMARVEELDAVVVWVADLFDFEAGMIPGLARRMAGKDIILVCTKRDLLPEGQNDAKIAGFVFRRLKEAGISVRKLIFSEQRNPDCAEEVRNAVRELSAGRPAVVIGKANAGKSTLLNALMGEKVLTSSRYPGTTLDFNRIMIDGIEYIDTPGIEIAGSMLNVLEESDLKTVLPVRSVKPQIFQLKDDQCFTIGGLAQIYLYGCQKGTAVFYLSERLLLHRSKAERGEDLWTKHLGADFVPVPATAEFSGKAVRKQFEKEDIVIEGLGWVCVSGRISSIGVKVPKGVNVTFREAMI